MTRRDVRTTITTTTSYNAFFGNNVTNVLSGVTTAVNRITGVYEVDTAIRLVLVNNTTRLFSGLSGVGTDNPNGTISGGSVGTLSSNNQFFTDSRIGNANYDMGHVFGRTESGGGVSGGGIGIVGRTGLKAQAALAINPPNNDVYYIDYASHEMGHQFGGRHNFNNCSGSLGDRRHFPTNLRQVRRSWVMPEFVRSTSNPTQTHTSTISTSIKSTRTWRVVSRSVFPLRS